MRDTEFVGICSFKWLWTDREYSVLRAMMMTACDLSAITKPWEVQSKVWTFSILAERGLSLLTLLAQLYSLGHSNNR